MLKSPSEWLIVCLNLINYKKNILILDLACGEGRNSIFLNNLGLSVVSVDISRKNLDSFSGENIKKICIDVENFKNWPLYERLFDIIVVTNFLNRSIFPLILKSLKRGGHLVYETFSEGNEKFGRPNNKNFILKNKELLKLTEGFSLICYESLEVSTYFSGFAKQRILIRNVQ